MITNNKLDISNYTWKSSMIVTMWNNRVESSQIEGKTDDDYPSYVYVLFCKETGFCKIGQTHDFSIRYESLCSSCGCKLKLKYVISLTSGYDKPRWFIEKFLKDYFNNKKIKGEWFNLNHKDLKEIEDLFYHIGGDDIFTESLPFLKIKYHRNGYSPLKETLIQLG